MLIEVIKSWIIHKFTVHCGDCETCRRCEVLIEQLEFERNRTDNLIARLTKIDSQQQSSEIEEREFQPIRRNIPWRVRQQMLESEDRKLYESKKQSVEELEKELGVDHAS